jgi:hypothetical protein
METKKDTKVIYDAMGRPYQKKLKTAVLYYEIPFDNPRKQLDPDMPIGEITAIDIRNFKDQDQGKYDLIAAIMCLQCLGAHEVLDFINMVPSRLNLKGEFVAVVPSFEWAASQVATMQPHPLIHQLTLGTPNAQHRTIFTLAWLRSLIEHSHLYIRYATEEAYQVEIDNQKYTLVRNTVIGWKYDELNADSALDSDLALS